MVVEVAGRVISAGGAGTAGQGNNGGGQVSMQYYAVGPVVAVEGSPGSDGVVA